MRPTAAVALSTILWLTLPWAGSEISAAQTGEPPTAEPGRKHVLFLAVDDFTRPFVRLIVESFNEAILGDPSTPVLYFETLDATRFQAADYLDDLQEWYRRKYASTRIDLVVTFGEDALAFLARGSRQLWPDARVLYFEATSLSFDVNPMVPQASGVMLADHFPADLAVIKRILPATRHVALVYGASQIERVRFQGFADKVRMAGLDLEPIDLVGVPSDRLVQALNELPDDTIVMLLAPIVDAHGQVMASDRPCELFETASNKPAFTQGLQDLGCGVVGGLVRDWTKVGRVIATRALALLKGSPAGVVTVPVADYTTLAFDARQIERWGISESRLPAGSVVQFRAPSLWRDYRRQVVAGVIIGMLQLAVIAALLVEHRRRRRAEVESRQHLVAMAHLDRRAAMGELATSLAHEINQPLNAILHNAAAGRMMVDSNGGAPPGELGEILDDIRKDDLRASEIIKRMRGLLKKHDVERRHVDLEELALDTVKLVGPDAASRGIRLELDLKDGLPPVLGDRVHLQQVLMNLMMNGMDAVAQVPEERRRVSVRTVEESGRAGRAVSDSGSGIAHDRIGQIFEPFFTTKGDGMGMGLAIARSIMDAHGGRIAAENNVNGGATVWFVLPAAGTQSRDQGESRESPART